MLENVCMEWFKYKVGICHNVRIYNLGCRFKQLSTKAVIFYPKTILLFKRYANEKLAELLEW